MSRLLVLLLCVLVLPARVAAQDQALSALDAAFRAAQLGMATQAGKALRQIGARAAAGEGPRGDLLRQRQELGLRLRQIEEALTAPDADRIALAGEQEVLTTAIAGLDARLAAEFPDFAALTAPRPLGVAEVQALLREGEALILVYTGPSQSDVFAISAEAAGWQTLPAGTGAVAEGVSLIRAALDPEAATRSAAALDDGAEGPSRPGVFRRNVAYNFYSYLLAPLEPVFSGAPHLLIVTNGPLTSLPFSLFVTAPPEGDDADPAALRATAWMIRDHALTTLPSVEALAVVRGLPPLPPPRLAFVGFGDPALEGGSTLLALSRGAGVMSRGLADVSQLRRLPALPQTRAELQAIARTLGEDRSQLILGAEATETAVRQADLAGAGVVAFATHGLLSGEIAGLDEPALVMSPPPVPSLADDGLLTASEIVDLKLGADWVILSACNTAGGERPGAEGLSGLARAFLFAGARSILVSHWPVRDDAAARLTTATFDELASGRAHGKADALRRAMLALMDDPRDPTLAQPSAWAPFVVVGEGG
jgi:CHAT domain-containing protein